MHYCQTVHLNHMDLLFPLRCIIGDYLHDECYGMGEDVFDRWALKHKYEIHYDVLLEQVIPDYYGSGYSNWLGPIPPE